MILNSKFSVEQLVFLFSLYDNVTYKTLEMIAVPKYSIALMKFIISQKHKIKDITNYIEQGFSVGQLEVISKAIRCLGAEQINLILDKKLTPSQMNEIVKGIKSGLSSNQVKSYADSGISDVLMFYLRKFYSKHTGICVDVLYLKEQGLSDKQIIDKISVFKI